MPAEGRYSNAASILGHAAHERLKNTRILIVGAGGIGSELLKNLVLVGFEKITIVDLDTIDLSNLNRQFLFSKPDISKPKAVVARATALQFNPRCEIDARHANIKDQEFDVKWMESFSMVFGALDNMDARRYLSRLCIAAGVPIIESGTAGYLGQVQPMIKGLSQCYDCHPKPVPTTFPVCTIRSTPSTPIHCIVWAKSYLFTQLFGEDDETDNNVELEKAKADGENAAEIENLKKEASAFKEVKKALSEPDGAKKAFQKIFNADINRLLSMDDMWKVPGRVKPTPMDWDQIKNDTFNLPPSKKKKTAASASNGTSSKSSTKTNLKDQKELTLKDNLELFETSCNKLAARAKSNPDIILSFDKDDDDTLDFVTATANLRAIAYDIEKKTRFEVKEMAGNIIPAIATTNAVTAALIVFQAIKVLNDRNSGRDVFMQGRLALPIQTFPLPGPNPKCGTCRDTYISLQCDTSRLTLGSFVNDLVRSENGLGYGKDVELTVYEGQRILYDPDVDEDDSDDNTAKTLDALGVTGNKWLTVVDETDAGEARDTVVFSICGLPSDYSESLPYILPIFPLIPFHTVETPPPPPQSTTEESAPTIVGVKRPLEDDDDLEEINPAKKTRLDDAVDLYKPIIIEDDGLDIIELDDD